MTNKAHAPVRPYSPIDALNRRAAKVGSPGYAMLTANVNYNGHHISVSYNTYRKYYIAEYCWAGRVVLSRGTLTQCVAAAMTYYNRGDLGASVSIGHIRSEDEAELDALVAQHGLVPGDAPRKLTWYTWRHEAAVESVRDYANPGGFTMVFDWEIMQAVSTREEYENAIRTKYGRVYGIGGREPNYEAIV